LNPPPPVSRPVCDPSRRRGLSGAEWLLLLVSTAVSFGLLELALRLFAPLYPTVFQPDEVALVKLIPGSRMALTRLAVNGGQRIVARINGDGFRGEELKPPDHLERVIVYGDSNVQAMFSELAATFPKQLESRLNASHGPDVEVLNAGVNGDGPDQISLRLLRDLEKFKPALVNVVVFADNDYGDLIRNKMYRLNARGDLELNHYPLAPEMRAALEAAAHPRGLHRVQLAKYAHWLLLRLWQPAYSPASLSPYAYVNDSLVLDQEEFRDYMAARPGVDDAENPFGDHYDADIALQPDSPSARYKIALMEKVLVRLRDSTVRAGTHLVLVILPSALDACAHYDFLVNTARYPQYDRSRLSGLIEAMATRNDIAFLNLWQPFRAVDANRYYFHGGDDHWNDAGQAKAAQLLADLIEQRRLLKPQH
jgi:hypothetical protein